METRAHFVLIGAAVLVTIACAFLFILWLGGNRASYDQYDVIFNDGASGLSRGSPVRFNGIQKGEVSDLTISEDDPSVVRARIRVEDDTPIKRDTEAKLELVGFTGLAVIQLSGGSKDAPLLKDEVRGTPQIAAEESGLAAFLEGSGDIIAAANRLLSEKNTETFGQILTNVERATRVIAENDEAIADTLRNTAKVTGSLAAAADKLSNAAEGIDRLVAEDAPKTLDSIESAAAELETLIVDVQALVDENSEPLTAFAEQGLTQVGPAMIELRRTFRTLDQVLREIDRDPRGYLLGESTPTHEGGRSGAEGGQE